MQSIYLCEQPGRDKDKRRMCQIYFSLLEGWVGWPPNMKIDNFPLHCTFPLRERSSHSFPLL